MVFLMRTFLFILFISVYYAVVAQYESIEAMFRVEYSTPLTIDLEKEQISDEILDSYFKINKTNPKEFYGIKTKRGFTRTTRGRSEITEVFHYIRIPIEPDAYTQDFYWYDKKKGKIVNSLKTSQNTWVLHGTYTKKVDGVIVEEGAFFKGKKHGRWVRLNKDDILQDKENYWKGWLAESQLSFYDYDRTKIREVLPIKFKELSGPYFAFHPNGTLAARGQYLYGEKVGIWREYYPNKRMKREVSYPELPFVKNKQIVIQKEWDSAGKLVYDRTRMGQ